MEEECPKALIFMSGRNCAGYLENAFTSLKNQTVSNFDILFVDDASTDDTFKISTELLNQYFPLRFHHRTNSTPRGKSRNAYDYLNDICSKYLFVAILDPDDSLCDKQILELMLNEYYQQFDVVYTNFISDKGVVGPNERLNPFISPRDQGWKTSHFFSFRASLFQNIPIDYFQDSFGEWITSACDQVIAYPILDQTRRYSFIKRNAYTYNSSNPMSHHNQDMQATGYTSRNQIKNSKLVVKKPSLPCTRLLNNIPGMLEKFIGQELLALTENQNLVLSKIENLFEQLSLIPLKNKLLDDLSTKEGIPVDWLLEKRNLLDLGFINFFAGELNNHINCSILDIHSNFFTKALIKLASNRSICILTLSNNKDILDTIDNSLKSLNLSNSVSLIHHQLSSISLFENNYQMYEMDKIEVFSSTLIVTSLSNYSNLPFSRLPILFKLNSIFHNLKFIFIYKIIDPSEDSEIIKFWASHLGNLRFEILEFENTYIKINN